MGAEQSKSNYTGGPAVRLGSGPEATGRPRGANSVAIDPQSDPRAAAAKAAEMRRKAQTVCGVFISGKGAITNGQGLLLSGMSEGLKWRGA